jgi:hypothetical protein
MNEMSVLSMRAELIHRHNKAWKEIMQEFNVREETHQLEP